jgi:hypothetical protein
MSEQFGFDVGSVFAGDGESCGAKVLEAQFGDPRIHRMRPSGDDFGRCLISAYGAPDVVQNLSGRKGSLAWRRCRRRNLIDDRPNDYEGGDEQ